MDGKKVIIVGAGAETQLSCYRKSMEVESVDIISEDGIKQHVEFEIKNYRIEETQFLLNQKIRSKYKRKLKYR